MQPSSMPGQAGDPYGFIMNPGSKKVSSGGKLPLPIPDGGSKNGRIMIIVAGAIILAIIASIAYAALSSGGDQTIKDITVLAERQNELARIAAIGAQQAKGTDAQNLALTTQYSIESDETQTLAYLSSQRHKVSSNQLKLLKNSQTDAQLSTAALNNSFDEVFTQTIGTQLVAYQKAVTQTYNAANGRPNAKKLMQSLYDHINTLAIQVKGIQESDQAQQP